MSLTLNTIVATKKHVEVVILIKKNLHGWQWCLSFRYDTKCEIEFDMSSAGSYGNKVLMALTGFY